MLDDIDLASGTLVSVAYTSGESSVPGLVSVDRKTLVLRAPGHNHRHALWQPAIAANREGLTHYHADLLHHTRIPVVASCIGRFRCGTNYALENGNGPVVPMNNRGVYHVAARTPEEAMELLSDNYVLVVADSPLGKRVMDVLKQKRTELTLKTGDMTCTHTRLSIDVDGAVWNVSYDVNAFAFNRVHRMVGGKLWLVKSDELPLQADINAYQKAC